MAVKYAKVTGTVAWSGGTAVLSEGRTTADSEHPLVKERPDLWQDKPGRLDFPAPQAPVERATRAPGERRQTRRD